MFEESYSNTANCILNNKGPWLNILSPHVCDGPEGLSFPHGSVLRQQRAMQPAASDVSLVHWRVSDPAVISHDILSEIGPGRAESRDQPLFCFVCPFQACTWQYRQAGNTQAVPSLCLSTTTAPPNASSLSTLLDRKNDVIRMPWTAPPVKL